MSKNTETVSKSVVSASTPASLVPLNQIDADWKWNFSRQFANEEQAKAAMAEMFSERDFKDLKASIAKDGLINPLVVRPSGVKGGKSKSFILVAGFRRFHALVDLAKGKDGKVPNDATAPAIVKELSDASAFELNVKENLIRKSISKFQVAKAAVVYLQTYGSGNKGKATEVSSKDVADRFGVSDSYLRGLKMAYENLHPTILAAWAGRDEESDFASFKATTWAKLTSYATIKDDKGETGTPAAHKRQLAAYMLEVYTVKLMADGKTTEDEARKQAEEQLEKNGFTFEQEPDRCEEKKDGKRCTLEKGHEGHHSYPQAKNVAIEDIKGLRKSIAAGLSELDPADRALADAAIKTIDCILKGCDKKIEVDDVVIFEPQSGDVQEEAD